MQDEPTPNRAGSGFGLPAPSRAGNLVAKAERGLVVAISLATLTFLTLPLLVIIPMSFSSGSSLAFPPPGYSLRWYEAFFSDAGWMLALLNSVIVGLASSTLALLLGCAAAYGLVRMRVVGKAFVEANFIAPLVVPPIIIAVALYIGLAQIGLLGSFLAVIVAHTVLAVPYVVLIMSVAISSFDENLEHVARSLGANEFVVARRVLIPNLMPSVLASWILAFVVSFDEVVLTLFLFGNNYTIPKKMFTNLELKIDPTIAAVSSILILFSIGTLILISLFLKMRGRKIL